MHVVGAGKPEFYGQNVFVKAAQHKQPNPRSHWKHREHQPESETFSEAIIADARIIGRSILYGLRQARDAFHRLQPEHTHQQVSPVLALGELTAVAAQVEIEPAQQEIAV